jgi:thiol-disulfide isomerase/thioredoxin
MHLSKKYYIIIIVSIILISILLYVFWGQETETPEETSLSIGNVESVGENSFRPVVNQKSPEFTFSINGESKSISDLEAEVVFFNFWATWCPPCQKEMPYMEEIHQKYGDKLKIIAVNLQETETQIETFMEENDLNFTVIKDEGPLAIRYQIQSIPKSFFLDKDGVIRVIHTGTMTKAMIEKAIEDTINYE